MTTTSGVAVIGKPNAGKSSLINRMAGEERVIVSDIAGTTRDAVDTDVENEYGKFTFIDTAGIRRKSKVLDNIERYSVLRALWPSTGRTSPSSCWTPPKGLPNRIPRWAGVRP